jgi:hypothetical protein
VGKKKKKNSKVLLLSIVQLYFSSERPRAD